MKRSGTPPTRRPPTPAEHGRPVKATATYINPLAQVHS
jgi:hypothetical protein